MTAKAQAAVSCMAIPTNVHFNPISLFWAASVATHGVYANRKTMKSHTAGYV